MKALLLGFLTLHCPLWCQGKPARPSKEINPPRTSVASRPEETPGVVKVYRKEDMIRLGGNTLSDLLCRIPGIAFDASNPADVSRVAFARTPGVEAVINKDALVLIDGRPVKDLQKDQKTAGLAKLPIALIDHVEVIQGPGSVLYGSVTYAGVINVVTVPEKGLK